MRRWFLFGLVLWTVTCHAPPVPQNPAATQAWLELTPIPHAFSGGKLVLARSRGKKLGVLADAEERSVHLLDLDSHRIIATHPFQGRPEALLVSPAGTIWVIDRDANAVVELALAPNEVLVERNRIATAPEPVGLGISPYGLQLFVSSRGDARLERIPILKPDTRTSSDAGHEPRGVAVLDDGTPVVGHASTRSEVQVSIAVTEKVSFGGIDAPITREQLISQEFAPVSDGQHVLVAFDVIDRDEPRSVEPKKPGATFGYGGPTRPHLGGQASVKGPSGDVSKTSLDNCNLPRAAAFDREQGVLYVACTGTDRVVSVGYRPTGEDPLDEERHGNSPLRFEDSVGVPSGPMGLAVDPEKGHVWIWSEFARVISVLHDGHTDQMLELPHSSSYDAELADGRRLFHVTQNSRISLTGFACASCHPDGGDDSQVWLVKDGRNTTDTLRQTPTLAGRVRSTDRFGWRGEDATLEAHLSRTVQRLSGKGLSDTERRNLAKYVSSLQTTSRTPVPQTTLEARGQALFESDELGCNSCHTEHGRRGGTMGVVREGGPLRSPSLRSVSRTAPYLHDGSLETLNEVLELKMKVLDFSVTPEQSDALLAYLGTL